MTIQRIVTAAAAAVLLATAGAASAQSGVKIGTLSCSVAPGIGFIIGSSKSMECQFSGDSGIELYSGVINKFGLDIGVTGRVQLARPVGLRGGSWGADHLAGLERTWLDQRPARQGGHGAAERPRGGKRDHR